MSSLVPFLRLFLNGLLVVVLLGSVGLSAGWLVHTPDYEPSIAMLSSVGALLTLLLDRWSIKRKGKLRAWFKAMRFMLELDENGFSMLLNLQLHKAPANVPIRKKYPLSLREQCIKQVAAGQRQADVAREHGISPALVSRWCRRKTIPLNTVNAQ